MPRFKIANLTNEEAAKRMSEISSRLAKLEQEHSTEYSGQLSVLGSYAEDFNRQAPTPNCELKAR